MAGTARHTLAGIALGLLILVGFVRWEVSRPNPLIDPRLFRHRAFTAATLSITVQFFAFFGLVFLMLQYLQLVRGDTPLVAALSLIPMALALMPSARGIAPRMSEHIGAMRVCVLGLVLITGALVVLSRLDEDSSYWLLLTGLVPLGAGMGLAMTPATAAITDALPPGQARCGIRDERPGRELGGALGIAVLGSLLQSTYRDQLDLSGLAGPAAEQARSSLASAAQLGPSIQHQAAGGLRRRHAAGIPVAAVIVAMTAVIVVALWRSATARSGAAEDTPGRSLIGRPRRTSQWPRLSTTRSGGRAPTCRRGSRGGRGPCRPIIRVEARGPRPAAAVSRRDLLESCAGSPRKLTLIRAPAGWGKSTLLADWHELESEEPTLRLGGARWRRQ